MTFQASPSFFQALRHTPRPRNDNPKHSPERRRIKHYLLALIVGISLKELTSALLVVAFIKEHVRTADAKWLYDIFFQPERRHKSLYALFTAHSDKVKISCNRAFEMGRYILLAVIAELFQCSAGMPKLNHCGFLTLLQEVTGTK